MVRWSDAGGRHRPVLLQGLRPLGKCMTRAADHMRIHHAAQSRRRAEIARWVEKMDALRAVTPRTADEAAEQRLAIARHIAQAPA